MNIKIGKLKLGPRPAIAAAVSDSDTRLLKPADLKAIDLIELRVDMFKTLSEDSVKSIFYQAKKRFSKPVLCTIRLKSEGGRKSIDDNKRYTLFKAVIPMADMVDIEIQSKLFKPVIKLAHSFGKPVIASYHNFKLTSENAFLLKLLSKAGRESADMLKLALKANSLDDVARLTCFTNAHRESNLITLSLGDKGRISRVINPFFGSLLTYGYVGKPKADGQMHVQKLAEQLKLYGSGRPS
jgi:3-dehydroquinate dehydratase I